MYAYLLEVNKLCEKAKVYTRSHSMEPDDLVSIMLQ